MTRAGAKWLFDLRPWMVLVLVQVPAIRNYFAASSLHYPLAAWLLVSAVVLVGAYLFFHFQPFQSLRLRLLRAPAAAAALLALTVLVSFLIYPRLEGVGRGGTGDDAMIVPVLALTHGQWMYNVRLFDGAPVSPGLGWVLFNGIFVVTGTFGLMNSVYLALAGWLAARKPAIGIVGANLVLICLLASFAFEEQVYSRQDLAAIGCGFLICTLLVEDFLNQKNWLWIGLITAVVASSRVIFIVFPAYLTLLYWRRNGRTALYFGIVSLLTTFGFHLAGYLLSDFYQPLHLILRRGPERVGLGFMVVGAAATLVVLGLALRDRSDSFQRRLVWLSLLLAVPLACMSFGELFSGNFDLATWEGARYWLPALPVSLLAIFYRRSIPA